MLLKALFTFSSLISLTHAPSTHSLPPTALSYNAAGVLPYALDSNGQVWILVGEEAIKNYKSCDFGGGKDFSDGNDSLITAAREGSEELLFIFDEDNDCFKKMLNYKLAHSFSFEKVNTYNYLLKQLKMNSFTGHYNGYITYLVTIDFKPELPELFAHRRALFIRKLPFCWAEKTKLHWLKLTDVIQAIQSGTNKVIDRNGTSVLLFYPFMQSVKNAYDTGALKSLLQ